MTTKITHIAMFAIAAVTVMSLGMTQAYAWSITNGFELENWVIPSGSGNETVDNTRCDNAYTITSNTSTNQVVFNWNGHDECWESHTSPTHSQHDFNKVRGTVNIDGTVHNIEETGINDHFGQRTYNQSISAGDEISVDFKWYYSQ